MSKDASTADSGSPSASALDRIPRSISKEALANLPIRRYQGAVHLVATPQDRERAAADLLRERVVGWDTETRPAFRPGVSYPPALFQAATARAVYLFRLEHREAYSLLADLLGEPRIVKAGVAVADDLRALQGLFAFTAHGVVDLGVEARRGGFAQTGLRNLAALVLGWRIPKGTKTTNWAAPRLTAAQVAYAAMDAWACRTLYLRFEELGLLTDRHGAGNVA